ADRIEAPCNISLGYRMDRTALFGLVRGILDAACERRPDGLYPADLYLNVVLHPFVKNMYPGTGLRKLLLHIERIVSGDTDDGPFAGRSGVIPGELETSVPASGDGAFDPGSLAALKKVHKIVFGDLEVFTTVHGVATTVENILEAVLSATDVRSYVLSGPIFDCFFTALDVLKRSLFARDRLSGDPVKNARAVHDIILGRLAAAVLPFDTHPIEELEILGMLEARNISFERLIVLDVNEGILPGPRQINPVIPVGVFDTLGVPPPALSEAIYRYNFYRLIGGAREVHLVYRASDDRPRSRYIEEIVWSEERTRKTINVIPVQKTIAPVNLRRDIPPPVIEKTGSVISALCARGFSSSMLDTYVACPLLFYFTRLAGLEEMQGFSTDIDAMSRGDIIHRVLFDTFLPFRGMPLTGEIKSDVLENLENALQRHFTGESHSGEYYLFRNMARYKLQSFIKTHLRNRTESFIVKYLEEKIESQFPVGSLQVKLTGKVDRIDCDPSGENYVIIDYKTGSGGKQYPAGGAGKTNFLDIRSIHDNIRSL
ncbi:hypothetical protein EG829_18755, partial [bacterium]|nr:hypothetical protein [bacterium]